MKRKILKNRLPRMKEGIFVGLEVREIINDNVF